MLLGKPGLKQLNRLLPLQTSMIKALAVSSTGELVASSALDGEVKVWKVETGAVSLSPRLSPSLSPSLVL